jgi:RND family efflux transporter MFP subunit
MILPRKTAALAFGAIAALAAASFAQNASANRQTKSPGETVVVAGTIDWLEKSDVSALTEGVVEEMEFQLGSFVEAKKHIGQLHKERAELAVAKAKIAATAGGPIASAKAKRQLAIAERARMERANRRSPGAHSQSEIEKADAEIMVAEAQLQEAEENKAIAGAELAIAQRTLEEHTINAPFSGFIIERLKNPGESVRANEPVVRLGRIDKLRFHGFVPLESAARIHIGDLVEVRPNVDGAELPVENKRFKGKVTAIQREIQTIRRTEVAVIAEIDNSDYDKDPELSLRPGLHADMTIYLSPHEAPPAGPRTAAKPAR